MFQSRCSDAAVEPLPGTAKRMDVCLALEYPYSWSHDVLDGNTLGELTGPIKEHLATRGAALQLIRRAGRAGHGGQPSDQRRFHLYLFFVREGITEVLKVDGPEAILDVDLSGPGKNGALQVHHPVLLVCTHSKRDACCAVKGRPLAAALDAMLPAEWVWESSHTKGHRFAPSMLLMPWGYSFGRLGPQPAAAAVEAASRGELFYTGNRGRGCFDPQGQVSELAVAKQLISTSGHAPLGEICAEGEKATYGGRTWQVHQHQVEVPGVVSSCGDEPKVGKAWQVDEVVETTGA